MRKVALALLLTAVGLGLLLSFRSRSLTGASGASALSGGTSKGASTTTNTGAAPTPSAGSSSSTATTKSGVKNGTFTGTAESTQYGDVQVQAIVSGGKLTNVNVLQVPDRGGYEDQIVQIALPQLKTEALSKQSGNIDVVSGATYTSQGYAQSLQSALDQAGL